MSFHLNLLSRRHRPGWGAACAVCEASRKNMAAFVTRDFGNESHRKIWICSGCTREATRIATQGRKKEAA